MSVRQSLLSANPFAILVHASVLCFAGELAAQSDEALDRLVFNPVLVTPDPASPSVTPNGPIGKATAPEGDAGSPGQAIREYEAMIAARQRVDRAYTPDLIQDLLALGRLYQQRELHQQALATFAEADHLIRVNGGLYHPQQIPLVESMVQSHIALEEFSEALDMQRYLLMLNQRNYGEDSAQALEALTGVGDRFRDKFHHTMFIQEPPAGFGTGARDISSVRKDFALGELTRAKFRYEEAFTAALENGTVPHPQLVDTGYRYLETLFLTGYEAEMLSGSQYYLTRAGSNTRWGFLRRNSKGYASGRETFERILDHLGNDPAASVGDRVRVMLAFGDWHLLFGRRNAAKRQYQATYALVEELGLPDAEIKAVFRPAMPLQLPLITPKPNSRDMLGIAGDGELEAVGWFDVSFVINGNGTAGRIKVLDRDDEATRRIERRLRQYLRNAPFRPYLENGELVGKVPVTLRYYYAFLPEPGD